MQRNTLNRMAARLTATLAVILTLAAAAGTAAPSAEAAAWPCSASAQFGFGHDGIHYCYLGRDWHSSGNYYADVYSTYVYENGVRGQLDRWVAWNGGWSLYGCYRTNPGFSGWVPRCPF